MIPHDIGRIVTIDFGDTEGEFLIEEIMQESHPLTGTTVSLRLRSIGKDSEPKIQPDEFTVDRAKINKQIHELFSKE